MAKILDLIINASSDNKGLKNTRKEMGMLRSEITLLISTGRHLLGAFDKLTDYSEKYNTSLRLLKTTLGETEKQATKFISTLSEMSGIDEATITKQTAKFVQLAQGLNMTNEQAEKFAENVDILTTKLALLYQTDYSTMGSYLQKALQGKPTSLTSTTGISVKTDAQEATLLAYGIDRQVSSLNDAEVALLKYATILRQVTTDTGVYQEAVNSLAWQKQMLSAQVKRLATAIGNFLNPVMTELYTIANAIVMVLIEIISMLASLVGGAKSVSTGVSEASSGYDELGKSIGGASAQAKKSLRAFDKLNNITTPSSGGGGGGSGLGIDKSMLGLLGDIDDNFLKIRTRASEIKDQIMEWLGFQKYIDLLTGETKYKFMGFDTVIKNIWKWWKNLNIVAKAFVGLGIYIVLTKIISAAVSVGKTLLGLGTAFAKLNGIIAGIVMAGSGLALFISAIQDIKENGATVNNVLQLLGGTLLTLAGAIITVGVAIGTMTGGLALIISLVGLVGLGIVGLIAAFQNQDTQVSESAKSIIEYNNEIDKLKDEVKSAMQVINGKIDRVKDLVDSLEGLVDANGKVVGSEDEVGAKLKVINDLLGTEYEITDGQITLNGELVDSYDELKKGVEQYCVQLRAKSELELLERTYLKTLEAKKDAQDRLKIKIQELKEAAKNYNIQEENGYRQWSRDNASKIVEMRELQDQIDYNEKSLQQMEQAGYLYTQNRFEEAAAKLDETVEKTNGSVADSVRRINEELGIVPRTI